MKITNKENLGLLIAEIEAHPDQFTMRHVFEGHNGIFLPLDADFSHIGKACIVGRAYILAAGDGNPDNFDDTVKNWLGCDYDTFYYLFSGDFSPDGVCAPVEHALNSLWAFYDAI